MWQELPLTARHSTVEDNSFLGITTSEILKMLLHSCHHTCLSSTLSNAFWTSSDFALFLLNFVIDGVMQNALEILQDVGDELANGEKLCDLVYVFVRKCGAYTMCARGIHKSCNPIGDVLCNFKCKVLSPHWATIGPSMILDEKQTVVYSVTVVTESGIAR